MPRERFGVYHLQSICSKTWQEKTNTIGNVPLRHGSVDAPRAPLRTSSAGSRRTGHDAGEPAQTPAGKTSPAGGSTVSAKSLYDHLRDKGNVHI